MIDSRSGFAVGSKSTIDEPEVGPLGVREGADAPPRASKLSQFRRDVLQGLARTQKSIPPKYLYDDVGSGLFEAITKLDEYYLSRAETSILHRYKEPFRKTFHNITSLIELGGVSSGRTEFMLRNLPRLSRYVPLDIAEDSLERAVRLAQTERPEVTVHPALGDFAESLDFSPFVDGSNVLVSFPGSSIGNFEPEDAVAFLRGIRTAAPGAHLLIAVDRPKSPRLLEAAYDDREGVTASFNLNLLMRINFELDANFDAAQFRHEARYDENLRRVEMHLVSRINQGVRIGDRTFEFVAGESIHTENSYKYGIAEFCSIAQRAGWIWNGFWTDDKRFLAVHHCRVVGQDLGRKLKEAR